jgi:hypothetical protein
MSEQHTCPTCGSVVENVDTFGRQLDVEFEVQLLRLKEEYNRRRALFVARCPTMMYDSEKEPSTDVALMANCIFYELTSYCIVASGYKERSKSFRDFRKVIEPIVKWEDD